MSCRVITILNFRASDSALKNAVRNGRKNAEFAASFKAFISAKVETLTITSEVPLKDDLSIPLTITGFSFPNHGYGYYGDRKIIVRDALPGQKLLVRVSGRRRKNEGYIQEVLEASPEEISPLCPDFPRCGGCTFQNIPYEAECALKERMALELFARHTIDPRCDGFVPAPSVRAYRNKMEFTFGDAGLDGELTLGMRRRRAAIEVVTAGSCNLVHPDIPHLLLATLDFFRASGETFYHKITREGTLRNLIVRHGQRFNSLLVNLVTTSGCRADLNAWAGQITQLSRQGFENCIAGILHTVNDSPADAVINQGYDVLYGQPFLREEVLGLDFQIGPFSFFQTNTLGAERLYQTVLEFAGADCGGQVIFDLYCGTGAIAQLLAAKLPGIREVYGIELVEEAVGAARVNAEMNGLRNCRFVAGDVLKNLDKLTRKPDTIILDPPREGVHPKALAHILALGAERLVYVSCKPTSLARDLAVIREGGYRLVKTRIHDMFPRTYHTECVALLEKDRTLKQHDVLNQTL